MARFLRQAEACTGGHKGAGLSDCNVPSRGRRDLRSGERTAGAIPRPSSHLRSDPSTLAARQPVPFAGHRRCGKSRPTQRGGPGLQPAIHPARGDMGCSSPRIEEGSRGPPGALRCARSKPAPCPSLGGARPMLPGEAIHRAPSLHRGGVPPGPPSSPRKRRRPRKGYAERVVRRHGSLASSHDRTRMPVVPSRTVACPPHQMADLDTGGDIRGG
jgi:hypothetical protein